MPYRNGLKKTIVGLLPAGGTAARVSPLPCSKEIFPIGFHSSESKVGLRPKASAHYLIENMQRAGAQKAYFILRNGKWDIPAYFGDGGMVGLPLGYLMMRRPDGVPFTLDQAYPFVGEATVLFGFPDILFQPGDAFVRLIDRQAETGAGLVIGLFPAHQPQKMDMVDLDPHGRVDVVDGVRRFGPGSPAPRAENARPGSPHAADVDPVHCRGEILVFYDGPDVVAGGEPLELIAADDRLVRRRRIVRVERVDPEPGGVPLGGNRDRKPEEPALGGPEIGGAGCPHAGVLGGMALQQGALRLP